MRKRKRLKPRVNLADSNMNTYLQEVKELLILKAQGKVSDVEFLTKCNEMDCDYVGDKEPNEESSD